MDRLSEKCQISPVLKENLISRAVPNAVRLLPERGVVELATHRFETAHYRQYTIVNADPDGRWYEIAVLREASGRGGSLYMHEEVDLRKTVIVLPPGK